MNTDQSVGPSCFRSRTPRFNAVAYPCLSDSSVSSVFQGFVVALCLALPSLAAAEVVAKDVWVRGTVPAQTSSGAFVTLTSTTDAKLVGAKSPLAKIVEIHESKLHNGVNHMNAVDSVALPAGKPVSLVPGGHHVMLMGLAKPLNPGDVVPIVFTIEERGKRSELAVKAEVRPLGSR